jgi:conjugal transfer pilus assembly protein TraB
MSEAKKTLGQRYNALSSGARTAIVGGAAVLVMFVIGTYIMDSPQEEAKKTAPPESSSLRVYNPGSTGATEGVAADLEASKARFKEQEAKIKLLEAQVKLESDKTQGPEGKWNEIANLTAQVQALQEKMNSIGQSGAQVTPGAKAPPVNTATEKGVLDKPLPGSGTGKPEFEIAGLKTPVDGDSAKPAKTIQVVGDPKMAAAKAAATTKKNEPIAYLPAGSNFEAVLLNGMDASTAIGANRTPTPALLRIKSEAILPNMFNFNVRECFVMVGGFGNMSSERVEMRTETASCIAEDGQVWEGKIEGYVVGEDGKAGARGRVVSKQGALLAKTFMAGFVGGLGGAFTPQPTTTLALPGATTPAYTYPSTDAVIGSGISTGLNKSSQALANFYIKLAEQMFPIVELDAGRKMTIILLKGVEFKMDKKPS